MVASLLEIQGVECEIVTVRTKGDRKRKPQSSLSQPPGFFTHELELAVSKKKVDCAIHSLDEVPLELREGLALGAILERDDPRDALVVNQVTQADDLASLPAGSRVGTSTILQRAQLCAHRRDLDPVDFRGGASDRLRKIERGQVHAGILPASALLRLGVMRRITEYLESPQWIPAVGQGAVAVEIREDDSAMRDLVMTLNHDPTAVAVRAERAFVAALDGAHEMPVSAVALPDAAGTLILHAFASDPEGRDVVRGSMPVDAESPEQSARALVEEMRTRGLSSLLLALRSSARERET